MYTLTENIGIDMSVLSVNGGDDKIRKCNNSEVAK